MKLRLVVLAAVLALAAFAPAANAAPFQFTASNFPISSASPYGTVTLTDVADGVQVDVALDSNLLMIMDAFGFSSDLEGLTLKAGSVTTGYSGWVSAGTMDGFGYFDYILKGPNVGGKGGTPLSTLSFVVVGGTASTLFAANEKDHLFAAHVYDTGGVLDAQTGFISDGAPVPEPATMLLLGTGLFATGAVARRRKK